MNRWLKASLAVIVLLLLPELAHALTDNQKALVGLNGLMLVVEALKPETEHLGITKDQIKMDVELRLRKVGISLLRKEEWSSAPGKAFLYVGINTIPSNIEQGLWSVTVKVKVVKLVPLPEESQAIKAIWTKEMTGAIRSADAPKIREYVGGLVDKFTNDYLAANPK